MRLHGAWPMVISACFWAVPIQAAPKTSPTPLLRKEGTNSPTEVTAPLRREGQARTAPSPYEGEGRGGVKPERLTVTPAQITLDSRRAYRQLIVTGYFHGEPRDLTHEVAYRVSDRRVLRLDGSRVTAAGNGHAAVTIRFGGLSRQVPVSVSHADGPDPVQFKFETLAVLTKQGCANGSCHGSPHGKGGFSLSLFGYDPRIDRISLTHDGFNRRVNVMDPSESLMLKKPLLEIPHVGGKRLHKSDIAYHILRDWIYQGANVALPKTECKRIVITPTGGRVLHFPNVKQQLSVLAAFTDGTVRDVTAIAAYSSSAPSVATVDANGLITGLSRGQAAVSVRYLDKLQSVDLTAVEDVPGFVWNHPPENNFIDRLTDAKLKQLQYLPSGICSDAVFIRRVSLDLTGLLPAPDVVRRFLKDSSPDKRARLIDALLDTEEYARFWALKQADLMRVSPSRLPDGRAERFAQWLTEAVRKNLPYDRFAREILTAQGDTRTVPPANYFLAIPTPEERTEMTAELFMGTRVECAKCHNHPFENWTMRDYYRIAAVFARTQTDKGVVTLASAGEVRHPTTGEVMTPWGLSDAQRESPADRRAVFAAWLTSPSNPYFARVEVNRLWANLMGRGIVEPVDDFRSSNPPSNIPLLDALAKEFIKSGYDRKHMIRLLCNSRTYQRSSLTNKFNATDDALFSHAHVRLLTAEQLKDAIGRTSRALGPPSGIAPKLATLQTLVESRAAALEASYPVWLEAKTREIALSARQDGKKSPPSALPPEIAAVLSLPPANRTDAQNRLLHDGFLAEDGVWRGLKRQIDGLDNRLDYATQRPYPEESAFTATFGQPKRDTACTCERQHSPTLLQALELLNGGMAYQTAQSGVGFYAPFDNDRLVEELYLSALCRFPTDKERTVARRYLAKSADRNRAVMDLIWTVINTQEFLFQH